MGFEPTRAEHIGLAVQRLNHSATSSSDYDIGLKAIPKWNKSINFCFLTIFSCHFPLKRVIILRNIYLMFEEVQISKKYAVQIQLLAQDDCCWKFRVWRAFLCVVNHAHVCLLYLTYFLRESLLWML